MTRFKLFRQRRQFSQPQTIHRTSTFPSSPEQHLTLPNYSTTNTTQNDNLVIPNDNLVNNTLVSPDAGSPIKIYSKTNYLFPPPLF